MDKINFTGTNTTYIPPKKDKPNTKGALLALGAGVLPAICLTPISSIAMDEMTVPSKKLNNDEVKTVNEAIDKIVSEETNLGEKGLKIKHLEKEGINLKNILNPNPNYFEDLQKVMSIENQIREGENAMFVPREMEGFEKNSVYINREKFSLATFHELGHAFNFHNSGFWRTLQSPAARICGMFGGWLFALYPAFSKDKKPHDGEKLTAKQKFNNWVRKYSPFLALGIGAPMLAEEAKASVRGCKWAKKLLDNKLYSDVVKTNRIAYTTYFITGITPILGAFFTKIVKDNSQIKKEAKQEYDQKERIRRLEYLEEREQIKTNSTNKISK